MNSNFVMIFAFAVACFAMVATADAATPELDLTSLKTSLAVASGLPTSNGNLDYFCVPASPSALRCDAWLESPDGSRMVHYTGLYARPQQ